MSRIKNKISKFVAKVCDRTLNLRSYYQKGKMAECGTNVSIGHSGDFYYSHIHIGNNVHIGPYASFMASIAHIYIADYVMFGPHVTIGGGSSNRCYWKAYN